jgi:sugar transferase (PEP-CTERM system associated)
MRVRILGQYLHTQVIALALAEAALFLACVYAAFAARWWTFGTWPEFDASLLPTAITFALCVTVSFFALGLYTTRQRARMVGLGLRALVSVLAAMAAVAAIFFFFPSLAFGRSIVPVAAVFAVIVSLASRFAFSRFIDTDVLKKRVLIYGHGNALRVFEKLRRRSDRSGYMVVGVLVPQGESNPLVDLRNIDAPDGLKTLCSELAVDEVVVALENRRGVLPQNELLQCRLAGVSVVDIVTFLERETGRIHLDCLNPSWMIFNEGFRRNGLRQFSARTLDFVASTFLLLLTLPIMLVTAALIWLEDGRTGGIFYRQDRVGLEGRIFSLLKFRSMRVDAEQPGKPQWAEKNDARVTRVGAFIRRTRIDELPQLLNVFQGHMSFVGPRPERPHFVAQLEERVPYYGYRHSVKPGITGWAQLCYPYGASEQDAVAKLQYDLYYVKNNSLLFDLGILVQTAEVVFLGKGAR